MTASGFYKSIFKCKTYKLSLDAGCTCPTRDGTKGRKGCIFCSAAGSGDFTPKTCGDIKNQVEEAKALLSKKLKNSKNVKYIAYFQSFTNTYGPLSVLSKKWMEALSCPDVVGLSLGTRPDCLSDQCLEFLSNLAEKTFVQVELGLQTSSDKTGVYIRRGFESSVYFDAVKRLHKANSKIHVVTHLIFGLVGESKEDMLNSVRAVVKAKSDGIKITCLYVLKNTDLEKDFLDGKFSCLSEDEYFLLVQEALKLLPSDMVIHRLTGDPPKSLVVEPLWTSNKKEVLNRINDCLKKADLLP